MLAVAVVEKGGEEKRDVHGKSVSICITLPWCEVVGFCGRVNGARREEKYTITRPVCVPVFVFFVLI